MQVAQHASKSQNTVLELTDRCPWCDNPISHDKFTKIQNRIREEERKKLAASENEMRRRLDAQKREMETQSKADIGKAIEEANKRAETSQAERDQALQKIKKLEAHEGKLKKEFKEEADNRIKMATQQVEQRMRSELAKQRRILDTERDKAVLKEQGKFNRERETYQKKMKELERQLEKARSNELGDGAEIDLFEALRDAFQGDIIKRITKAEGGADILHKVQYKGETCGTIVYDSKNRQAWREAFVEKLRADQISAGADHAILATAVFPSGKKELFIESDVIIACPARVVQIATLLREAIIKIHLRGLSTKEKANKMTHLYQYITSDGYNQRFHESQRLVKEILDLDVQEKKDHDNVWKKRGSLLIRSNRVLKDIETEISAILEAAVSMEDE